MNEIKTGLGMQYFKYYKKPKSNWKLLCISGKTYIIRIVSSRRIFEKKMAIMSFRHCKSLGSIPARADRPLLLFRASARRL